MKTDLVFKLTELYYELVSPTHHKERDCHFSIEVDFCGYKENPTYFASHQGYIFDIEGKEFDSYSEAEDYLLQGIIKLIGMQFDWHESGHKHLESGEGNEYDLRECDLVSREQLEILKKKFKELTTPDYPIPVGYILKWGLDEEIPKGYLLCDGSSISRAHYKELFEALGTAYGCEDEGLFNLPDKSQQGDYSYIIKYTNEVFPKDAE